MSSGTRELETIVVERSEKGVTTITLSRPRVKNAIDGQMWAELGDELRRISDSSDDRVVVLTGAGGDFCSGADVSGMSPAGGDEDAAGNGDARPHHLASMRRVGDVAMTLHRLPQPTIAKVRGIAAGAGLNMALLCDLVVAGETARFSEIFARRGLTIDFGGSWILPRRVGLHRAKELTLLAEIIDAAQAREIGLVNRVLPDEELDAFVDDWAGRLAGGPPIALAMSKRLLDNSLSVTLEEALDDEGRCQTVNFATRDTAEAVSAFLAKREPAFEGR
jgi:2-(1,2-epoxy-1,2-dihydrophenyl)acetyl-CoA isomerase